LCDKVETTSVVSKIISLQISTAIISYIILCTAAFFIFDFKDYLLLLIFSVTYIAQIFSIRYYYLANNKLYYNSISELAGQLIYAALIFLFFKKYPSVTMLIIFSVIQAFVTATFLFFPYFKKNKISLDLRIKSNLQTVKEAYKLGLSTKAEGLTSSFIILSTGMFLNSEAVGLYNASNKIYLILLTVVQGVSFTLMPILLSSIKSSNRNSTERISLIFYVYLIIGILLFLFTIIFAETIISVMFGSRFSESVYILKIFSLTILIWPVVMFLGLVMLAYNKYNYILAICISSMIFSVTFSLLLIGNFGLTGAAFVLPSVGILTIIISLFFLKKISKVENFEMSEIFSIKNSYREFINILSKKSTAMVK